MASTYTANQGIEKMDTGDQSGTWGGTVNTNMDIIDRAISGVGALTLTGSTTTLTTTDGTLTDGMYRVLVLGDGGDLGSDNTITLSPNDQDKAYLVYNNLSANRNAIFTQGTGANATVQNGETAWIYADGAGSGAVVRTAVSSVKITDQDGDTQIQVEEGGDDDDTIRFDIAGAEDFTMTANTFNVLSGSTLDVNSGATITNNGTATGFGADAERAFAGVLQTNSNFVDQTIFGPSVDGMPWNGLWSKASVFSSLMLATIEQNGSDAEINIWDLTEQSGGAISTTPLATIAESGTGVVTGIAAAMGYVIVGCAGGVYFYHCHDGAWKSATAAGGGWPRYLNDGTSPALTNNDVEGVAAGFSDQPAYDPRTGGPLPTFACSYGTGADIGSIIKDDGNVFDKSGTVDNGAICLLQNGKVGLGDSSGDIIRISQAPISSITADDWAHGGYGATGIAQPMPGLGAQNAIDGQRNLTVAASASGLTYLLGITPPAFHGNVESDPNAATAMITRTYNTGYLGPSIRGAWLANSKTTDHSTRVNTLTENGTVTEGAVESGAELKGYSGFSSSNNLTRSSDADWNSLGTGSAYLSCWFKSTGASAQEGLHGFGASDDSIYFNIALVSDGTIAAVDRGATAQVVEQTSDSFEDSVWHKVDFVRVSSTERYLYVDGVLKTSSTTDAGSISGTVPLGIGVNYDGSSLPATSSTIALARLAAIGPSATLVREMYEAEKGMFVASAECLLQSGSTDAVLDVNVDPLTKKVLVTQTDAITVFDGFVVDSKPTVNSGSSEKGKLWGDLRAEQNSANAYVTAPTVDQRQVNEMVRGLANDLPKDVDLSKAKAWVEQGSSGTTPSITASYNVKSLTRSATGNYTVTFAVPFKSDDLGSGAASKIPYVGVVQGYLYNVTTLYLSGALTTRFQANILTEHWDGTDYDSQFGAVFFGELENE
jgi:hypothetical protein